MLTPRAMAPVVLLAWLTVMPAYAADDLRRVINLDGTWEVAEGALEAPPARFDRRVPVPGLVDMAGPAFADVGVPASTKLRQAFWYRRTFRVDRAIPAVATLKVHKALFGTRVYVNGKPAGEHLPCFTPGLFDVRQLLKEGDNELLVCVGAFHDVLPKRIPYGHDFEKTKYIPGIYDSVELILSGVPHIVRVQAAPDLPGQAVRVVVWLRAPAGPVPVQCRVREAKSGRQVAAGSAESEAPPAPAPPNAEHVVDLRLPMPDFHAWSPEDPFLYEFEVTTSGDTLRGRFGMRSFAFDPQTGRALLNGKPYYLRGTNVCIYRFFEDPARGDKPWRQDWVRTLHQRFKHMNWNAARYCIGFPPEFWYRIADEEGILIQDEFPIWYLGDKNWPAEITVDTLAAEYREWMQERWNHPCVAIWDAQNETVTKVTGEALQKVRGLDLSHRPWDNGWGPAMADADCREAHPYLASNASWRLPRLARQSPIPGRAGLQQKDGQHAVILNEYGWLWLNRDGTPCTLSKRFYEGLLGPQASPDELRRAYARLLAAKTEFWRSGRKCAGVLHFCGLGYSRPGGQTSDHFIDLDTLTFEPHFARYVRDAFAPVGLMIDWWDTEAAPGQKQAVPVAVINDLDADWQGPVTLRCERDGKALATLKQELKVPALGRAVATFELTLPMEPGRVELVAELAQPGPAGPPTRSVRPIDLLSQADRAARRGIAAGKKVTASSNLARDGATTPDTAVDGDPGTRWSSEFADPQWLAIDLGQPTRISRVELAWQGAYGKAYTIEVSSDGQTWQPVYRTTAGQGGVETIRFSPVEARYVRLHGTQRGTEFGYSLWEFRVFP